MATTAEQLILRGIHLMIRTTFSPNDPVKQAEHFKSLQNDIGPWLKDYVEEIEKPPVDWNVEFLKATGEDPTGGPIQH